MTISTRFKSTQTCWIVDGPGVYNLVVLLLRLLRQLVRLLPGGPPLLCLLLLLLSPGQGLALRGASAPSLLLSTPCRASTEHNKNNAYYIVLYLLIQLKTEIIQANTIQ